MRIRRHILFINELDESIINDVLSTVKRHTDLEVFDASAMNYLIGEPAYIIFNLDKKKLFHSKGIATHNLQETALVYGYGTTGEGLGKLINTIGKIKQEEYRKEEIDKLKKQYNRQVERKITRANKLIERGTGNRYSHHELGYLQGAITTLENVLDDLEGTLWRRK